MRGAADGAGEGAAITKISTATMMFGRKDWTFVMNAVSAAIFRAPMAAEMANRKMNQKTTVADQASTGWPRD